MAYTIISQNNTTTTLQDENGNIIYVPGRVTLATSTDYTITEVNNNTATLTDGSGKVIRDVPCVVVLAGGGGGDQHNLGWYATESALTTAHPTAEDGDWAIIGSTDTVWVWDSDTSAWVDSDQKGQVTSVNNQTGAVTLTASDVGAIPQVSTMPTATATNVGEIVQYVGETDANYTNGYFYKNVGTTTSSSATASQTTGSSLSDVAVVLATFETQITTSGSYAFTSDGTNWSYDGNTVDLTDYGITYTGTPVADDVITVVYTESSTTYAWTRIDVQPSPNPLPSQTGQSGKFLTTDGTDASWAAVNALPSQTGQSGKFLTTDGTDASWSDKPLVNKAVREDSLAIVGIAGQYSYNATVLGIGAKATTNGIAIGKNANAWGYVSTLGQGTNTVAIGNDITVRMYTGSSKGVGILGNVTGGGPGRGCVAICGNITNGSTSNTGLIAIGGDTSVAGHAIQLGDGNNSTANTMQVWNYKLLDKTDGTIPTDRLTKVNSTITLTAAGWSAGTQTVTVNGITATSVVWVSPDPSDQADYVAGGILCTAQAANSLTFTASTTPTNDIDVVVVAM